MANVPRDRDPIATLLDRVSALGFPRNYVEAQMPSWWSPEARKSGSAVMQLELTLARRLGLDVRSLLEGNPTLAQRLNAKYKRARRYTEQQLAISTSVCVSLAEAVSAALQVPYSGIPRSPAPIRELLFEHGAKRISLSALVMYCWHVGLPVIHARNLPDGVPKMDGLVVRTHDRPVIVLAKQSRFQAWLLFILAHELGHIAHGHVEAGELLIDEEFEGLTPDAEAQDTEEVDANTFALELLNGTSTPDYQLDMTLPIVQLAREAMTLGQAVGVDPGHILLVQARNTGRWREANAALAEFQERDDDARSRINQTLAQQLLEHAGGLEETTAGQELAEFVYVVTGQPIP